MLVLPSADIHITLEQGSTLGQDLLCYNVFDFANITVSDNTIITAVYRRDNGIDFIRVMPLARGICWIKLLGNNTHEWMAGNEQLVKITVHDSVQRIWIGNNRATVFEGLSNHITSVFAEFRDTVNDIQNPANIVNITSVADISGQFGLMRLNGGNFEFEPNGQFLNYSSNHVNNVIVNNSPSLFANQFNQFGRITGLSSNTTLSARRNGTEVSNNSITVSLAYPNTALQASDSYDIYILPSLLTPMNDLVQFYPYGKCLSPEESNTDVLIIAEGYGNNEENTFNNDIRPILDEWFATDKHQPLKLLQDNLNIWKIFLPSAEGESGITAATGLHKNPDIAGPNFLANPVPNFIASKEPYWTALNQVLIYFGLPNENTYDITKKAFVTQNWKNNGAISEITDVTEPVVIDEIYKEWRKYFQNILPQTKDSFFGFAFGGRFGEKSYSDQAISANNFSTRKHYTLSRNDNVPRQIILDRRRDVNILNNDESITHLIINSCKYGLSGPANPFYDITQKFILGGASYGLSCFICNEAVYGGAQVKGSLAASLADVKEFRVSMDPAMLLKWNTVVDFTGDKRSKSIIEASAVFAHEFSHANLFNLQDEYDGSFENLLNESKKKNRENIALTFNTTHYNSISKFQPENTDLAKPILADSIKWNEYRVKMSIMLIADSNYVSGTEISILVSTAANLNPWKAAQENNQDVFISTKQTNALGSRVIFGNLVPLRISNINIVIDPVSEVVLSQTITLALTKPASLNPLPIYFQFTNDFNFSNRDYLFIPLKGPSAITAINLKNDKNGNPINGVALKEEKGKKRILRLKDTYGYEANAFISAYIEGTIGGTTITNGGKYYVDPETIKVGNIFKKDKKKLKELQKENPEAQSIDPEFEFELRLENNTLIGARILDSGAGFDPTNLPLISIYGGAANGSNVTDPAELTVVLNTIPELTFEIVNGGTGYSNEVKLEVYNGFAPAQTRVTGINYLKVTEVDANGVILNLVLKKNLLWNINNLKDTAGNFQIPTVNPVPTINPPTSNANIVAKLIYKVKQINITKHGSGYVRIPTIVIDAPPPSIDSKPAIIEPILGAYSRIIDHAVLQSMQESEKALEENLDCNLRREDFKSELVTKNLGTSVLTYTEKTENFAAVDSGAISNLRQYRLAFNAIGLFEGAAIFNCHAYRPSGISKLRMTSFDVNPGGVTRIEYPPFNYVCQYLMVSLINAEKLNEMDKLIYKKDLLI